MIIETLSTFPDMYSSVMGTSMMRIAQEKGILQFKAHDLRDWTHDRHRTTDDEPYGGGQGLVMKCEPIFEAYDSVCLSANGIVDAAASPSTESSRVPAGSRTQVRVACANPRISGTGETLADSSTTCEMGEITSEIKKPHVIFLAPTGRPFTDEVACELAREDHLLFICGHYEGIDERAYTLADSIISLGDYVLTSGELASMVVIDAVVRKLPGVLGAEEGAIDESFADGLLEYPQYTRPAVFRGMEVPAVLLSGHHAKVARWKREESLRRTAQLRPDLLEHAQLSAADRDFLETLKPQQEA